MDNTAEQLETVSDQLGQLEQCRIRAPERVRSFCRTARILPDLLETARTVFDAIG